MLEAFYGWVEDITVYMIVITLIYKLSANSAYKPYIKLFTGLLMVIIIMTPIAKIWNGDWELELNQEKYNWELESARISEEIYNEESRKIMLETYGEEIEQQVRKKLTEYDLFLEELQITFGEDKEYGIIKNMKIIVSYENNEDSNKIQIGNITFSEQEKVSNVIELKMKEWLSDTYGVEQADIYLKK